MPLFAGSPAAHVQPAGKPELQKNAFSGTMALPSVASGVGGGVSALGQKLSEGFFSSLAFSRPLFESIEGSYINMLLFEDLGMWISRLGTAAMRGRDEYLVDEDPNAKDLPLPCKVVHSAVKNIMGLNWKNVGEETIRELQAGPSLLIVPTATFLLGKRFFGMSDAYSVPVGSALRPLNDQLGTFLQQKLATAGTSTFSLQQQQQLLSDFVHQQFNINAYPAKALNEPFNFSHASLIAIEPPTKKQPTVSLYKTLKQWGEDTKSTQEITPKQFKELTTGGHYQHWQLKHQKQPQTLNAYLKNWSERWAKTAQNAYHPEPHTLAKPKKIALQKAEHQLELLNTELKRNMIRFNREHLPGDAQLLHKLDKVNTRFSQEIGIDGFTSTLSRWKPFALKVLATPKLDAQSVKPLIEGMHQKLLGKKWRFALTAFLLNGLWLASISVLAQHGKNYPANRLAQSAGKPKSASVQQPLQAKSATNLPFNTARPAAAAMIPLNAQYAGFAGAQRPMTQFNAVPPMILNTANAMAHPLTAQNATLPAVITPIRTTA
ncbi:MAG: hypothetical protein VKJ06_04260 [Vampirovibrionales bacterium]|nr:hypothetical protein [Vampirovibrionales bacterium]